ncbi:MAG: DUF2752 domain-containing protein [Planctomycetota bacterium]|jgi:hypothetical protein
MQTSQQLNNTKMFRRASSRQRLTAAIVCVAVAAYFGAFALMAHYEVDMGRHLGYCGFKQRTGWPCLSCGMTTATLAFAQGDIVEAFLIQPAVGFIYCAAVLTGVLAFVIAVFGVYFNFIRRFFAEVKIWHMILALVVILAAGWAVTLARAMAAQN